MKKGILSFLALSIPFILLAQNNTSTVRPDSGQAPLSKTEGKGIQWNTGLSWEQVKQKAKLENKYIFIDAYTTWCKPCKMMDNLVYPNDTVGNVFNEHFIAVKAQMDKTEKDEQATKDWYDDAAAIGKEFGVNTYPSLIFLSPDANIIQKEQGYKTVQQFVSIAKEALTPSKIHDNPFKEYRTLVDEYKQGVKHYGRMPYVINKALEFNDPDFAKILFKEYLEYASTLDKNNRYTQENIKLWSLFMLKVDSKALGFFLRDGEKIDKVMSQKGYSRDIVDKTIQSRIVDSFFRIQKGVTTTITGKKIPNSEIMFMWLPSRIDGKIEPDLVEADWKKLKKMILEHFGKDYATRNLLMAKVRWYKKHQNMTSASQTYFTQLDKYPPADGLNGEASGEVNQNAWETFLYSNDKKLLGKALAWMRRVMHDQQPPVPSYIDTYANLLYKLGHTKEAISWQEKAIELIPKDDPWGHLPNFQLTLEQMKKGEPTKLKKGAIWL